MPLVNVDGRRLSAVGSLRSTGVAFLFLDGIHTRCCDAFTEVFVFDSDASLFVPVRAKYDISQTESRPPLYTFVLNDIHDGLRLSHRQTYEAGGPAWTVDDEPLALITGSSLSYWMTENKCIQFGKRSVSGRAGA